MRHVSIDSDFDRHVVGDIFVPKTAVEEGGGFASDRVNILYKREKND